MIRYIRIRFIYIQQYTHNGGFNTKEALLFVCFLISQKCGGRQSEAAVIGPLSSESQTPSALLYLVTAFVLKDASWSEIAAGAPAITSALKMAEREKKEGPKETPYLSSF